MLLIFILRTTTPVRNLSVYIFKGFDKQKELSYAKL